MKKTLVVIVIFGGLLVGADFVLAAVAENRIAAQTSDQFELSEDPDVTVHGFPFTTQAVRGDYQHISASAEGVPVTDILQELELTAELRDVDAPLTDVLDGNTDAITIGELEGTVRVTESDLGRAVSFPSLRIDQASEEYVRTGDGEQSEAAEEGAEGEDESSYGSTAAVQLEATTNIAGEDVDIVALGMIELERESVLVQPQRIELAREEATTVLPEEVRQSLLPQFETTIEPGSLPFNVAPTGVGVEEGALIVQGEAEDVRFADGA